MKVGTDSKVLKWSVISADLFLVIMISEVILVLNCFWWLVKWHKWSDTSVDLTLVISGSSGESRTITILFWFVLCDFSSWIVDVYMGGVL